MDLSEDSSWTLTFLKFSSLLQDLLYSLKYWHMAIFNAKRVSRAAIRQTISVTILNAYFLY